MTKLVSVRVIFLNTSVSNHTITITGEVTHMHTHYESLKQRQTLSTYNTNTRFETYKHSAGHQLCLHQLDGPIALWPTHLHWSPSGVCGSGYLLRYRTHPGDRWCQRDTLLVQLGREKEKVNEGSEWRDWWLTLIIKNHNKHTLSQ